MAQVSLMGRQVERLRGREAVDPTGEAAPLTPEKVIAFFQPDLG